MGQWYIYQHVWYHTFRSSKNVHTPDILFTCAFSVRSRNTVRLALLAKERKKMYVFGGVHKMHQKEGKITKNIYTQRKTYLLNVFLLKNNFTEKNPLYYNLHVTERTVMLLVIDCHLLFFHREMCFVGREGLKGNKDRHNSSHPSSNTPISSSFLFSA